MLRLFRACVVAALTALLAAATVEARDAADGNPRGVALIARVQKRYLTVPGVKVTVPAFESTGLLSLRSGIVVAQKTTFKLGAAEDIFVARRGNPIYELTPSKRCWKRLPPAAGVTFYTGLRFPILTAVQTPKRVPDGWSLQGIDPAFPTEKVEFLISAPSYLLRSVTVELANGKRLVERVSALAAPPQIPATRPVC